MDNVISRQAAIDVAIQSIMDWDGMFIQDANCRISNAINELPSAEPNPFCALADRSCPFQGKEFVWCLTCPHISEEDRTLVKKAVEPKTGRWVGIKEYCDHLNEEAAKKGKSTRYMPSGMHIGVYCDQCWKVNEKSAAYCPNCGADMRGEQDENR